MFDVLKKPHPFVFNIYSVCIPSIITFLLIVILAPFPFQDVTFNNRVFFAFIISILVALSILITINGLKKLFPKAMSVDTWTIGREFLLVLVIILVITILISTALVMLQLQTTVLDVILKTATTTLAISIFPLIILILFEQYRYQTLQLKKAEELTASLKTHNEALQIRKEEQILSEQSLLLKSENNDVTLQLRPQEIIYLKSDGNYIDVYFYHANTIQKKVIRNRLKAMEEFLPSKLFFRCHNRFIINGSHIIKVEGNARNLVLHLKAITEPIPVSRSKAKAITLFLDNLQ